MADLTQSVTSQNFEDGVLTQQEKVKLALQRVNERVDEYRKRSEQRQRDVDQTPGNLPGAASLNSEGNGSPRSDFLEGVATNGDAASDPRTSKQPIVSTRLSGDDVRVEGDRGRFRRWRVSVGSTAGEGDLLRQSLEAEVALLSEENACLRARQHTLPDPATVMEWTRRIAAGPPAQQDVGDEALQSLAEALMMREILLEACEEIGNAMEQLKSRLSAIEPILGPAPGESASFTKNNHLLTSFDGRVELEEA